MLKALELIGFKSFADKTRFEFPPGITVVVGPNGSGKSNIVDAIKWVLGETSAKSLRGKDMADVIFKGSGESGRKMVNSAEATIVFDNSEGRLPVDSPEVHITRRVYRSGEGEYLINREPCRLKDIRDMVRGTGVGAGAYSLIEQGKVDRMLQASARDRRAMFEEAAGISRFKAKKLEAQRRLERVDQNLLRLSDIVDEVGSRLRSVRSQASKARRYREYRDRLQQLRTQVGLTDWRQLSERLDEVESRLARLRDETAQFAAQAESLEAQSLELDVEHNSAAEAIRLTESRASQNREQIAGLESSVEQARSHATELEESVARSRRQLANMTGRAGDLQHRLQDTRQGLEAAESQYDDVRTLVATHERSLGDLTQQLDALRCAGETQRQTYVSQMRSAASLGNKISSLESQQDSWTASAERARQQLEHLDESLTVCHGELQAAQQQEQTTAEQLDNLTTSLESARQELSDLNHRRSERGDSLAALKQRISATKGRVSLLEELDKNQEGLAAGVREVLELAREATEGPFAEVQGLVADLLQVSVDVAPLIDVALGEKAQHIVVAGNGLRDEILAQSYDPAGRVGFVPLDDELHVRRDLDLAFAERPGVLGRLDQMVACDGRCRSLVRRLLDRTWCVESLALALSLRTTAPEGWRFVTLSGELVESDGTVVVGSRPSLAGLVSRRSELRMLKHESSELDETIDDVQLELTSLEDSVEQHERGVHELEEQSQQIAVARADHRAQSQGLNERCQQLERQQTALTGELDAARTQLQTASEELETTRRELIELEEEIVQSEQSIQEFERQIEEAETHRDNIARETTTAKVELAKCEQHVDTLRGRLLQLQEDQEERRRAIGETQGQLVQSRDRYRQTERELLRTTSELAELYLRKDTLANKNRGLSAQRDAATQQRTLVLESLQSVRRRIRKAEEQQHQCDLDAEKVRHERTTLAERLREDYEIEIAELENELSPEESAEREEVEQEINDLRRKINNIGAVNLEALDELDDLESRFGSLSSQYNDLKQAKEALERIIQKINADSRRLFQETLEDIRINFQSLYRMAFGGGKADLVLEEGVDPLEAGVDIIATPPGKPSFNNSLLSGGEKALTAVSLLLAIFQYRPSPFCVLDEVDAPFDEANIGRFINVLKGFLGWTKFVIVTHSKKTMTAATTLYGVTMQESGVSKRVSVRFEDVTEDGHILREAVDRETTDEQEDERGAA